MVTENELVALWEKYAAAARKYNEALYGESDVERIKTLEKERDAAHDAYNHEAVAVARAKIARGDG